MATSTRDTHTGKTMYKVIRKNANKQIEALLNNATYVTVSGRSFCGMTDSTEFYEGAANLEQVREFMTEKYNILRVVLVFDEQGNNDYLRIETENWYDSSYIVNFKPNTSKIETEEKAPEAKKPKMTYAALKAYREAGYASPLNHGGKEATENNQIAKVTVRFSESRRFESETDYSIEEYNRLAWLTLLDEREYGNIGYCKTYVIIHLKDGQSGEFRHDICIKERDLVDTVNYHLKEYAISA